MFLSLIHDDHVLSIHLFVHFSINGHLGCLSSGLEIISKMYICLCFHVQRFLQEELGHQCHSELDGILSNYSPKWLSSSQVLQWSVTLFGIIDILNFVNPVAVTCHFP
jgi:hypothetical protein